MKLTSEWRFRHSWLTLSPMCTVWGCSLLHPHWAFPAGTNLVQRPLLPSPPTQTSCQNVTALARVLTEIKLFVQQEQLNKITNSWAPPTLFLDPRNPPTHSALTCRGSQSVRFCTSKLWESNNSTLLSDSFAKFRMCLLTPFTSELKGTPCSTHRDENKPTN